MATIRKHYGKWQVLIRHKGHKSIIKSFVSKTEAKKWARSLENKFDRGDYSDYSEANKLTLSDLFKRYINEGKHKHKKGWRIEEYKAGILIKDTIAETNLLRLSTKHISEFRDRRVQQVSPTTYNKDLSFISVVIDTAMQDWRSISHTTRVSLLKERKNLGQGLEY